MPESESLAKSQGGGVSLQDKVAIVTGGGSGIGAAIAVALAREGARVVVVGRRASALEDTVKQVPDAISAAPIDIGDRQAVESMVASTLESHGRIDVLVNSAGTNTAKRSSAEVLPEEWERILQVNATGAFHCIQSVLAPMKKQGGGLVINISSVAGMRATLLGGLAYNASKFAMSALGITVGEEERDSGIRVTNIYPGEVETPILDARPVPVSAEHRARILQPEDVASAVLMICHLPERARVPELSIIPTIQTYT